MEKSKTIKTLIVSLLIYILNCVNCHPAENSRKHQNTVTIPDSRSLKLALGYQEDTVLNFTELATKYGYETEEHTVVTEDGYFLKLFRITQDKQCRGPKHRVPVLLMHGLFDSADVWILPNPKSGLGYILADACYDVWAANHRGNVYSRKHVRLNPDTDAKFWDYSFDEHGQYDLPSIIDYILLSTQSQQLYYIGHSQGTTDFFVMASSKPEYNAKVKLSIHLAPVAWMKNNNIPLLKQLAQRTSQVKRALDEAGLREIFARHQLAHNALEFLCTYMPSLVCGLGLSVLTGYQIGSISDKALSIGFGHLLSGESTRTFEHYGQLVNSGKFAHYDEGPKKNLLKYGSRLPKEYDISKITSPVVLIAGQNDWTSSLKDVEVLRSQLPNVVEYYVVPDSGWSHNNHVWGKSAPKYVFSKVLSYLTLFDYN